MENGYVLVHVLEALVPGHDLGENPACEITLGDTCVPCPVPSTLQSENVALPIGNLAEPVVHVRAYSSQGQGGSQGACVGLVVVPVSSLVPLEVWNVWYAMDGEGEGDYEDKPPEETPKMHLLLQCVSAEVAAEETPQLREMRAQDFLLRALQQLNASLEAKVLVNQGRSHSPGPGGHVGDVSASCMSAMSAISAIGDTAMGRGTPDLAAAKDHAMRSLNLASLSAPNLVAHANADPHGHGHTHSKSTASPPRARSTPPVPSPMPEPRLVHSDDTGATAPAAGHKDKVEELLQRRIEPYERIIAALEEKQRFYDDQESRVSQLTRALEEQEQKSHEFYSKLQAQSKRCTLEVQQEQESTRRAFAEKCSFEQMITELQQEVALRRAHEDSLQKRVALMENELSVVHQKCVVMDSVEEQALTIQQEALATRQSRAQLEEKLEEQTRIAAENREELARVREEQRRELDQASQRLRGEQLQSEDLRASQQAREDAARDAEVQSRLRQEKFEEMARHISSLEGEVAAGRALIDTERQHRRDVERKFEQEELQNLHSVFYEHRETIKVLREEVTGLKNELEAVHGRGIGIQEEVDHLRAKLGQEQAHDDQCRHQVAHDSEIRHENQRLLEQNEAVRAQLQVMQQETRKMAEHYEREFSVHSRNEQISCQERLDLQKHAGDLELEVAKAKQQVIEARMVQDQAVKSCATMREAADRSDYLQSQLLQAQEDIRGLHDTRTKSNVEVGRLTSKFQHDILAENGQASETQAMLEDRNHEIKLLMYRVQELSSKYNAVRNDNVDVVLAKWVNGYRPAVPFFRLSQGVYLFGRRQVICKIVNDKPVFRVGGGFIGFDKFLELYASEELERLLSYEMDERTGEPKFIEAQKVTRAWEEEGDLEDGQERSQPKSSSRGPGPRHGMQSQRLLDETASARSSRRSFVGH